MKNCCFRRLLLNRVAYIAVSDSEISVNGNAYFQILVTSSLEESLRLSFNLRTISSEAVIMYGAGENDFHSIEVDSF